jgi:hypothetical protein
MSENTTPEKTADGGLPSTELLGFLSPNVVAVIKAAKALQRDAEVHGMMGASNSPAIRCEVKGLCLGHWHDLRAALDSLPNSEL